MKQENNLPKELNTHNAPNMKSKLLRIEIGEKCYKNRRNDYTGKVGYIFFCDDCCHDFRVQFFDMGNNELLRNFDLDHCKWFMANNYKNK